MNAINGHFRVSHVLNAVRDPMHAQMERADSEAMKFGRYIHSLLLGSDEMFAVVPQCDRRTKEGKAIWAEFCERSDGATIITSGQEAEAKVIVAKVQPYIERLGPNRRTETRVYWEQEGVKCTGQIDIIAQNPSVGTVVCDLKTTRSAEPRMFASDAARRLYHAQLYAYSVGLSSQIPLREIRQCIIAVETTPPYPVAMYWLDPWRESAELKWTECLEAFKRFEKDGWPDNYGEVDLYPPTWAIETGGEAW